MSVLEVFTLLKDALLGIAAVVTATVAIVGLRNWSREIRGKAEFDAARSMARSTYRLRDAIENCRGASLARGELEQSCRRAVEKVALDEPWLPIFDYPRRAKEVVAALEDFDTCTLEAEALWGPSIRNKTDQLRKCVRQLFAAYEGLFRNPKFGDTNISISAEEEEHFDRLLGVAANAGQSAGQFAETMEEAIRNIENDVRPRLQRNRKDLWKRDSRVDGR